MPMVKRTKHEAGQKIEWLEEVSQEEFDRMFPGYNPNNAGAKPAFIQGEGEVRDAQGNLKTKFSLEGIPNGSDSDQRSS